MKIYVIAICRTEWRGHNFGEAAVHVLGSRDASARRDTTAPPNSCKDGVGVGATFYNIPILMSPLRQQ
jgi:hypothetical protein